MAAQGLAAYGQRPRQFTALAALRSIQSSDGGFPFLAAPGQTSDPDSTALAIQAILAEQGSPGSAPWVKGGATPYTALATYQLGCGDPAAGRGAFFYPGDRSPNTLASVQAVPALAGVTFPQRASALSTAKPREVCAAVPTVPTVPTAPAGVAGMAAAAVTLAGTAGHCPGATGVTVAVDLTAFGKGVKVRCAPGKPATGIAALQQAGFTVAGTKNYGLAFVCRINGLPTTAQQACITTPADERVLGVLPRARRCDDVVVQHDRAHVVQAPAGQHRGLGVRREREAEQDPGPGACVLTGDPAVRPDC
jgi:hypothetical protein